MEGPFAPLSSRRDPHPDPGAICAPPPWTGGRSGGGWTGDGGAVRASLPPARPPPRPSPCKGEGEEKGEAGGVDRRWRGRSRLSPPGATPTPTLAQSALLLPGQGGGREGGGSAMEGAVRASLPPARPPPRPWRNLRSSSLDRGEVGRGVDRRWRGRSRLSPPDATPTPTLAQSALLLPGQGGGRGGGSAMEGPFAPLSPRRDPHPDPPPAREREKRRGRPGGWIGDGGAVRASLPPARPPPRPSPCKGEGEKEGRAKKNARSPLTPPPRVHGSHEPTSERERQPPCERCRETPASRKTRT